MKRNFWTKTEVKCMLSVFKDLNIVQLLEQKTLPINDIYKRVEIEMGRRGFKMKTGKQIQSKWSQMKSAYICIKRNHKAEFYKMKDPEFRDDVAELVEADPGMKVPIPPLSMTDCSSPCPSGSGQDDNTASLEEPDERMEDENEINHSTDPSEIVQCLEEPQEISYEAEEPVEQTKIHHKGEESPSRQGSYKKSFWRFMQQLKALELDLQEEFLMKQTRLLAEERKLQVQRDNLIIASFAANTNQILKSTQELLEKGFSR